MSHGLGSRKSNRIMMAVYAGIVVVWSAWRAVQYATSEYVQVSVVPTDEVPPVDLFAGRLVPGNVVELDVAKTDLTRLAGMIDAFRYTEIATTLALALVALAFVYRFCDRVLDGRAFGKGAAVDLGVVSVCLVLYPFFVGMIHQMGTNSVLAATNSTEVLDTARSFVPVFVGMVFALFLQFIYATVQQGAKLAEDTEGLV